MIRRVPSRQRNAPIVPEGDRYALMRLGLLLVCGLGLASGFVYAGRQHFAALKYGYETENLRRERDQLADQQRRYLLQREEAASPVRLERAAKQLGMQPLQPAQIDPLRQSLNSSNAEANSKITSAPNRRETREPQTKPKPTAKAQMNRALNKPI